MCPELSVLCPLPLSLYAVSLYNCNPLNQSVCNFVICRIILSSICCLSSFLRSILISAMTIIRLHLDEFDFNNVILLIV